MYETDYMQHKAVCDKYIVRTSDKCEVRPLCIAISEMDYSMCGRLVTVQSLLHADTLPHWYDTADYTSYSLRKFKDACGDSVNVTTSRYALFADKPIPSERVTVTGILSFDGRCYKIKPRDETDIGIR